ncbi:MAG: hypothetical protein LBU65_08195 [Planctomycetaceae bacterium]|jgi:predicted transposase/invertase (TIGR01784 family)|nr:hypothetical protein [Planctomycetaceae bacterium]
MLATKSPQIKKAVGVLMELSADERTRLLYEEREKIRMDESAKKSYAEKKLRLAKEKARLEGELKGKREIARNLLSKNMSIEEVMGITDLSRSEIENLR